MIATSEIEQVTPAFGCRPHLLDPTGTLAAWFTDPPGAWLQFIKPGRGTDELSEWIAGPALCALVARFPRDMLILVLDFRLMTDRDLTARARILQTAPALKDSLARVVVLPSHYATPLHMKTMAAGVRLARAFGLPIELETAPATQVLSGLGLRASTSGNI